MYEGQRAIVVRGVRNRNHPGHRIHVYVIIILKQIFKTTKAVVDLMQTYYNKTEVGCITLVHEY